MQKMRKIEKNVKTNYKKTAKNRKKSENGELKEKKQEKTQKYFQKSSSSASMIDSWVSGVQKKSAVQGQRAASPSNIDPNEEYYGTYNGAGTTAGVGETATGEGRPKMCLKRGIPSDPAPFSSTLNFGLFLWSVKF